MNFVKEENLWQLERRTIMELQYNIQTKLLHLDTTFTELVVTDWLKKSIIALSAAESWWKNDIVQNSIVYLLSLIAMVHKEIQKY